MTSTDPLRDSDGDPDAYAIVGTYWPYDGPYGDYITSSAALAIAELTRYLNNATSKSSALPGIQTVSRVLTQLNSAAYGYHQLFEQLKDFVERAADDPTLYDDRDPASQGGHTARDLAAALSSAQVVANGMQRAVENAAQLASRLGNRRDDR